MVDHLDIRRGVYADSVSLMQVSRRVADVDGVDGALVAMATELNLELLAGMGFEATDAGPNDLVVAVRAADDDVLQAALAELEAALAASRGGGAAASFGDAPPPRTVRDAAALGGDLALVSVPGEHAYVEALDALRAGLHVMLFSDNVPLDAEIDLKRQAEQRGLLVMGPDAGTAIVSGVGLGFANVVPPGPVGVVAASGTGAQQLTCLLDDAGVGVSHVLGVGGRDLKEEVGGRSTLQALQALDADPATEVVVILSKPPAASVADRVRAAAAECKTPVVMGLLGPGQDDLSAITAEVLGRLGREVPAWRTWGEPVRAGGGDRLVGLFAGGTLCAEALLIAEAALGPVTANVGERADADAAADPTASGHVLVDLGEDEYTRGRPHPMIDQQLRLERIAAEAARDDTAVLLLDVVLGHGAHPDPAGELAPAIADARRTAAAAGRELAVVVSLCGTVGDPQGRDRQAAALAEAGAQVFVSNAAAARAAVACLG
ncbi:FdrA family protein [Egicoccus sp. AB-alg2]|uniref:FdrA family protein n=1 Tax=Egicoccus sp. AB-alg2 TaxID=3242693 RepID=UPI00359DC472